MRSNYPLLSQELNDIFLTAYERYVSLLGFANDEGVTTYSGQYDIIQSQYEDLNRNYTIFSNVTFPNPNGISVPQKVESLIYQRNFIRS